jgi:hypothetical protein
MARHAGRFGRIMMSTDLATPALTVVSLNSWDLNAAADRFEVTSFFDPNKVYVIGLRDRTGNFAGFWDDDESQLWTGADSDDGVYLYAYPDITNNPQDYGSGTAWVDASITVPVNGAITVQAQWAAAGAFDISRLAGV